MSIVFLTKEIAAERSKIDSGRRIGEQQPPAALAQAPLQAGAVGALLDQVQQDPALSRQILQLLLVHALNIA